MFERMFEKALEALLFQLMLFLPTQGTHLFQQLEEGWQSEINVLIIQYCPKHIESVIYLHLDWQKNKPDDNSIKPNNSYCHQSTQTSEEVKEVISGMNKLFQWTRKVFIKGIACEKWYVRAPSCMNFNIWFCKTQLRLNSSSQRSLSPLVPVIYHLLKPLQEKTNLWYQLVQEKAPKPWGRPRRSLWKAEHLHRSRHLLQKSNWRLRRMTCIM